MDAPSARPLESHVHVGGVESDTNTMLAAAYDLDGDGIECELTVGKATAVAAFPVTLPVPDEPFEKAFSHRSAADVAPRSPPLVEAKQKGGDDIPPVRA